MTQTQTLQVVEAGKKTSAQSSPVVLSTEQEAMLSATAATASADGDVFDQGVPIMGERDDAAVALALEDKLAPVRITEYRAMHVNLRSSDGSEIVAGATTYLRGSGGTFAPATPTYDSTVPANNAALPVMLMNGDAAAPIVAGQQAMASSLPVVIANNQSKLMNPKGYTYSESYRADTGSAAINTGAWTQAIASTAGVIDQIHAFNGTGISIQIAIGAAGSEAAFYIIPPGGDVWSKYIAAGTRVAIQPYANCTDGEIVINVLGV